MTPEKTLDCDKIKIGLTHLAVRMRWLGVYIGGWTLLALYLLCAKFALTRQSTGFDDFLRSTGLALIRTYGWALVSLFTISLLKFFPLYVRPTLRNWSVHIGSSLIITLLGMAIMAASSPFYYPSKMTFMSRYFWQIRLNFHYSYALYYWGFVGFYEGVRLFRHLREKRETTTRLKAELAKAQLNALEMHLSAHFLFNTLNSVAALLKNHPNKADQILLELRSLLQAGIDQSIAPMATLKQELTYLETYLAIEKVRFGDRLRLDLSFPEPLLDGVVPSFLLQPIVEAAIARCVSPRSNGGSVKVKASLRDMQLHLEVISNESLSYPDPAQTDLISNLSKRLQGLYGNEQAVETIVDPKGWTTWHIWFPWSTESTWQVNPPERHGAKESTSNSER